jgi:hypothetical protein
VTVLCRVLEQHHVLKVLREIDREIAKRAERGGVFCIARRADRVALKHLYDLLRHHHRHDARWIEDHSPLRQVASGHGLKWVSRDDRPYLSLLGGAGSGTGSTAAHEWVQGELCELGELLQQARSEAEFPVPGGKVDVAWDVVAWEVDLTAQPEMEQRHRAGVRHGAGLRMISLVDSRQLGVAGMADVPRVGVRHLEASAAAGTAGQTDASLARQVVDNLWGFDLLSHKWRKANGVRFDDFCTALLAEELVYGAAPGSHASYRWLRRADLQRAEELERSAAQKRASQEAADRVLAAARAEAERLRVSLATLATTEQQALVGATRHREAARRCETEYARVVALAPSAERAVRGYLKSGAGTQETAPLANYLARIVEQPWWIRLWARLWAWMKRGSSHDKFVRAKKAALRQLAARARAERQHAKELESQAGAAGAEARRISELLGTTGRLTNVPQAAPGADPEHSRALTTSRLSE